MTDANDVPICVQCGMCCDGTLFDSAPLTTEEAAGGRSAGIKVEKIQGEEAFAMPCGQLAGTLCRIYENRPKTCRAFRCATLEALEGGEISRSEALRRIRDAKDALAAVGERLPPGATVVDARRWRRKKAEGRVDAVPEATPDLLLALGVLDIILDTRFREPAQRQVMPRERRPWRGTDGSLGC